MVSAEVENVSPLRPELTRPAGAKSLSTKFSVFTTILVFWVIVVVGGYDISLNPGKVIAGKILILLLIVFLSAGAIARFTIRILVRPLAVLQRAIQEARAGRLTQVDISRTGDEIEYLAESFNQMSSALAVSQAQVKEHQELLEERIRLRTEELEEALQKAMQASQAKSEFLANMSHELRTPMSGVIGMLDLVMESPLNRDQLEQLKAAQGCAHSLLGLLNDLLDLSKIEAGRMVLEEIPFEMRALVADCTKTYQARAKSKGISMSWSVDQAVPRVLIGDPLRVRQILANLVSNAVKFTERGSVRVEVRLDDGCPEAQASVTLRLSVADTGPGIAPERHDSIFEQFTQADGSISRRFGGTGLGLAISKRLVEMHGGEINLQSAEGLGSAFSVLLPFPVASDPAGSLAEQAEADFSAQNSRGAILVVEDNLINQKVVTSLLRKKGYETHIANNGQEALDMLHSGNYQLVLMDVQMPVLDGLEASQRIRAEERYAGLPIIAMTAHAMNGDRERCLKAGMNEYLAKPVDHKHLIAVVEQFLKQKSSPRAAAPPAHGTAADQGLNGANPALREQMLKLFVQLAPDRIKRLHQAAAEGNLTQLREDVQKIQAAARSISAANVVEWTNSIEESARRVDLESIRTSLSHLDEAVRALSQPTTHQRLDA